MTITNSSFFKSVVCVHLFPAAIKLLGLLSLTCIGIISYAQQHHPTFIDFRTEKLEYQGYTIRPIPAISGAYGYDIFSGNKLLVHQYEDPVPGRALNTKEDVYKVAEWVIAQYTTTNHFPTVIPPAATKKLKLSSGN